MNSLQRAFGLLILVQAIHSVEEYAGRLWESFPPAAMLTGLISEDRERAFLALNVALRIGGYAPGVATAPVLFILALWVARALVRRDSRASNPLPRRDAHAE
jgi:hypothetical protein